jgi:AbiV family abortive infection protein
MVLMNSDGKTKRGEEDISEAVWETLKIKTIEGIKEKLAASKQLLEMNNSVAISAALYTFALEEYGKFLLLQKCSRSEHTNRRHIVYARQFADHKYKFNLAFQDLAENNHTVCYLLNDKGEFNHEEFSWEFNIGLLADTEARLSILHTDLMDSEKGVIIQSNPEVEKETLSRAIGELESVIGGLALTPLNPK